MFFRQWEGHGGHALSRLHCPDALRDTQIHQPAARPDRRLCRQIGCAGVAHGAADNQQFAEIPLVAVGLPGRKGRSHKVRLHGLGRTDGFSHQVPGDADVPHLHFAGQQGAVAHRLTNLFQCKGYSPVSLCRTTENTSCIRCHTAGDVRRHDFAAAPVHQADSRREHGVRGDFPGKSHAEDGVDQHMATPGPGGLAQVLGVKGLQLHATLGETARLFQGVGGQLLVLPHQEHPDPDARQKQHPCRRDAVPAVVARAAEHRRPALPRPHGQQRQSRLGHALRRPLHQVNGGDAPLLDGLSVQFLHLCRCRQFHGPRLPCRFFSL